MMEQLKEKVLEAGAKAVSVIEVKDITFRPEFRQACEQNSCGKYNTNWGCPPACGTIEEMMEEAKSYPYALVYQTVSQLEDSFDYEGMVAGKKFYNAVTEQVRNLFAQAFPQKETLFLNAGACKVCSRCAKLEDQPCRFPEKRTISMEAYGVDVSNLAKVAGMNYINGENTVTYFGAILYR
jgi:predicted metal-binding protein